MKSEASGSAQADSKTGTKVEGDDVSEIQAPQNPASEGSKKQKKPRTQKTTDRIKAFMDYFQSMHGSRSDVLEIKQNKGADQPIQVSNLCPSFERSLALNKHEDCHILVGNCEGYSPP